MDFCTKDVASIHLSHRLLKCFINTVGSLGYHNLNPLKDILDLDIKACFT